MTSELLSFLGITRPELLKHTPSGITKYVFWIRLEIALIVRALVQAYGGNEGVESAICAFVFPLVSAFDNMYMNVAHNVRISLINDK